jgi:hypothetical protein
MTAAVSLASLAGLDAIAALSRCASVQTWLGTTVGTAEEKAEAAAALIFHGDAGTNLPERYLVVTVKPLKPVRVAVDLTRYGFDINVEAARPPADGDESEEDFLVAHNLGEVGKELEAQHQAGDLDFELVDPAGTDQAMREDDNGERPGDLLNVIDFGLEAFE